MAIKSVTPENLAEFAANRPQGKAPEAKEAKEAVVAEGGESISDAPSPGKQPTAEELAARKPKKNSVQDRIDELVKERSELDEAFQSEYEQRLRLEGELKALKASKPDEPEKPPEDQRPDRSKYTAEQSEKYEDDLLAWNRKQARKEFAEEEQAKRLKEAQGKRDAAMTKKLAAAKADFPDFTRVMDSAVKRNPFLPDFVTESFYESDVGGHLAYHLAKDGGAEEKRILSLPRLQAVRELAKLEEQYTKKPEAKAPEVAAKPQPTIPEPVSKLKESSGVIQTDLSQPMDFKAYRAQRVEQIRTARRSGSYRR